MKKAFLFVTTIMALVHASVHADNIWIEAESGAEYDPIVVKSDLEASGAIYLGSWEWADYGRRSKESGLITYQVYIEEPGDYTLWARARTPWGGIRAYDVSFGAGDVSSGSDWSAWSADDRSESQRQQWGWLNSGVTQYLSKGMHSFHLIQREGGPDLHLDKLLLTNDAHFVPSGQGGAEATLDIENPYVSSTVQKYGNLKLVGNQLSDQRGNPVQLQGISAHGLQWFPLVDNQTIPYMAEFFGVEAVRLAMYIEDYAPTDPSDFWGGYVANKEFLLSETEKAIEDAVNAGVYVLVDWHIHNVPSKYTAEAKEFFTYISKKYGHLPNIIYEICNEPVSVSWSNGIKPYAETIISAIRANDPDNMIIVGTPNWSQDVDAAAQDPLRFENVMYAFHYYAATHDFNQMSGKVQTALDAGLAIFVSEWGTSDVGTSSSNFSVAERWMRFMNERKLSWVNWSLGNKDESSSVLKPTAPMSGPWDDSDLTQSGRWLKPYFDTPAAGSSSSAVYSSVSSVPVSSSSVKSSSTSVSSVSSSQSSVSTSSVRSTSSSTSSVVSSSPSSVSSVPVTSSSSESVSSSSKSSVASSSSSQSAASSLVIEGEHYAYIASGNVQVKDGALGYFDAGDQLVYESVDLTGVTAIKFRYATGSYIGSFQLRLDHPNGEVLVSHIADHTGSYDNYIESTVNLTRSISGERQLYLVGTYGKGIVNLDRMELIKGTMQVGATIEAEHYSHASSGKVQRIPNGLGYFDGGDVVHLGGADWTNVTDVRMIYASNTVGNIELRLDGPNGHRVLAFTVQPTGGYDTYRSVTLSVPAMPSGWHDLYLVGASGSGIMNLDKVQLIKPRSK